jgi:hypothetical protein
MSENPNRTAATPFQATTVPQATLETNTQPSKYAWVTQPLILACATGLAYFYAYQFEVGYCYHFRIPNELIKIDVVRILIMSVAMIAVVWGAAFIFGLFTNKIIDSKQKWWVRLLHVSPILVILGGLCWLNMDWALVYMNAGILAMILYLDIVINATPFSWGNKLIETVQTYLGERIGIWTVRWAIYLYYLSLIVNYSGAATAGMKGSFLVPIDNPNLVVLTLYGDTVICAKANVSKREIYPIFFFYSMNSEFTKGLELKKTGTMKVLESRK